MLKSYPKIQPANIQAINIYIPKNPDPSLE